METPLPHVGILPNRLWPAPASDGHGALLFMSEPRLHVLLEVFSKASRSPLHIHTHADRFLYVADGELTVVTEKNCFQLKADDGVIIRANTPHGFLVPEGGVRCVSVALGNEAQESKNELPPQICALLAPIVGDREKIQTLKHETRWKDLYSQFEVQTLQWAKQCALTAAEKKHDLPFSLHVQRHTEIIPLQGWKCPNVYILKVRGYAVGFSYHGESGQEYLKINRINAFRFGLTRSEQPVPVLK